MVLRAVGLALRSLELSGRGVLVAVSGGLDSTTLLHTLARLSGRHGLKLWVGHVNHGLRGAESEGDQAFVEELGAAHGVPVLCRRVDPSSLRRNVSSRLRPTLQEAARSLRREALVEMAVSSGAEVVATAHHADDQAETVLLRLLRGTGPDGLGGMSARSRDGRFVRPLLRVPRAEIDAFARAKGLVWREDSSNRSHAYARNRLRSRWVPGLREDFNPALLRAIVDLAEAQRTDAEWIQWAVERELGARVRATTGGLRLARSGWSELHDALARRLVARLLTNCGTGRDVRRVHLMRMLHFLRGGRTGTRIELPGGLVLRCEREAFWLGPREVHENRAC
ncbi:MAG TPA: tRNA lysidine(34) synthetase TilS [Myxococcota bacterium]|nr:tRNA lysidine(34) synthetase TilS [Myxococcota bacterium]